MIKASSQADKVCVAKVHEADQDHVFEHWDTLTTDTSSLLQALYFPNDSLGYAAGTGGVILKTLDTGQTWTATTMALIGASAPDPPPTTERKTKATSGAAS